MVQDIADITTRMSSQLCSHAIANPAGIVPTAPVPKLVTYTTQAQQQVQFQATHAPGNVCPAANVTAFTFTVRAAFTDCQLASQVALKWCPHAGGGPG